jgi:transcriptional regulator with XRE-family HTH domain
MMKDIKSILAENISALRQMNNMTQAELGEKLNYSDKAVSKWERGESVPDISVLLEIAELFGVTLDSLVKADNMKVAVNENKSEEVKYNRRVISYISESVCFLVAIFAFIITTLIMQRMAFQWLYIVYALPIALIVKLVFNSVWFNPRRNYLIISALMWSVLAAIHITFLYFDINVALIYLIGVAGQTIIILWSFLRKPKKEKTK